MGGVSLLRPHRKCLLMASCLSRTLVLYLLPVFIGVAVWAGYYLFQNGESKSHRYRFDSFAPERNDCHAKWFVDGQDYMSAVADAIESASNEIFIADWQISPHIFMKRPDTGVDSLKWRLDKILLRKADQGIRVYILLYWESKKIAKMDHGSNFAKFVLKHHNIKVLLHPDEYTMIHYGPKGTGWWSHHEKVVVVDRNIAFVGGIDLCFGRWDTHNHELTDDYPVHPCAEESGQCGKMERETRYSRWVGKDYGNTFLGGDRTELDHPMDDYVNRSHIPRMPWHDIGCLFTGPPARDVAKHFIQRYNSVNPCWWMMWDCHKLYIEDTDYFTAYAIPNPSTHNVRIQVLRSVDKWSAGQTHEASIYNAYLHAIKNAKHFIYIENQFFISSQPGTFLHVSNQILSTMADRIVRAYQNNEDFHMVVVMPLKPEFPGQWETDSGKDLRSVSYWNYLTIYSGEDSLYNRLKEKKIPQSDIHRYFTVYGLRTHATLNGNLVTEIIYVHSKLMVVDDRMVIIGSANINDRSMLGNRDSEVAIIIEDTDMINGKMKGQPFQVGKFSHSLRCHLMREHLGLLDKGKYEVSGLKVEDPLANNFHPDVWKIAEENSLIYERVFRGRIDPTNQVWNLKDLANWRSFLGLADIDPDEALTELRKIRGRLVFYPVMFLKDVLKPSYLDLMALYVDNRGRTSTLNFDEPENQKFVV